jgi:hypothetical protein
VDRKIMRIPISETQQRIRVTVVGDPCAHQDDTYAIQQHRLLEHVVNTPELVRCDYYPFDKLYMHHNGSAWVIDVEAVVETT